MTSAERHRTGELARLRRILANADATPFEKETARASLERLKAAARPVPCPHCLEPSGAHNGAVCKVVARFQRRAGKTCFPTAVQSEELRKAYAEEEAAALRGQRKRDAKARQSGLF